MNIFRNLFKFFINKPLHIKLLFFPLFVIYGATISYISYSLTSYYQSEISKNRLLQSQRQSFKIKTDHLKLKMNTYKNNIYALKNSLLFDDYIKTKNKNNGILDVFAVLMNSNKDISQLRFIDELGKEQIRFHRDNTNADTNYIKENRLQNKISRYYFKEIKNTREDKLWYSKLDLNVEYGVIQKPIVPTLRIGTAVYENNTFKGIIIMNIFFKDTINSFVNSSLFNISIFDEEGQFIYNKIQKSNVQVQDNSWSRYLQKKFDLYAYNDYLKNMSNIDSINEYFFSQSISTIIPNKDVLAVFYEPKMLELKQMQDKENSYILTVTIIVLLLSITLAFVISIIPNILSDEFCKESREKF